MLPQTIKKSYFLFAGPLMRINGTLYRMWRAPRDGLVRVQLGPGQKHYLNNWVNVDANFITAKCDVWADLRYGLPFPDSSVDTIYSHHVIEHLPDLQFHFHEIYRCLKPNGVFRIGGPNGDAAIQKYVEGDAAWFSEFPDKRNSIGGRIDNFLFCRGEHLAMLTFSYLQELAQNAGFKDIQRVQPIVETHFSEFIDEAVLQGEFESTPECPHTLIVEGKKSF